MNIYSEMKSAVRMALQPYPVLEQTAVKLYAWLRYYGSLGPILPKIWISEGWSLSSAAAWAGVPEPDGELFFGYFDDSPWSSDGQRLICHRVVNPGGPADILIFDREKALVQVLSQTETWNYQQGSLARWLPEDNRIILNDKIDGRFATKVIDCFGRTIITAPCPQQAIHPSGHWAVGASASVIGRHNPDYGYQQVDDDPRPIGIWEIDLKNGEVRDLLLPGDHWLALNISRNDHFHEFNHFKFNVRGDRLAFIDRVYNKHGRSSRLAVISFNDREVIGINIIVNTGMVSHYCWIDNEQLLVFCRLPSGRDGFAMVNSVESGFTPVNSLIGFRDGHPTCAAVSGMTVIDSYPDGRRQQRLWQCDRTFRVAGLVAVFYSPLAMQGPRRCDLHPRFARNSDTIAIDTTHSGTRRLYVLERRSDCG